MARVAEALERVDEVADVAGQHDVVDEAEQAARLEHAVHLGDEGRDAVEVVRRDAAGDEVEARVVERQRLRLGVGGAEIGRPFLAASPRTRSIISAVMSVAHTRATCGANA